ncbi:MAG: hypothetical protein M1814_001194 [Vezdaea aestivalis]|nr:MAG: hypothetical protein M1814_001194 [Vezdaea aestivalis]
MPTHSQLVTISALGAISTLKRKMKQHNILLDWIEEQRQEIAKCVDPEENDKGRLKRASSSLLQNQDVTKTSVANLTIKTNDQKSRKSAMRSVLSPMNPTKVFKAPKGRRSSHRKMNLPYDAAKATEKPTTETSILKTRKRHTRKVEDT